ncbi:PIG-L deacetylase family protein [Nonomuraea ferruginea]
MPPRTAVFFHAHPDDEALLTAGTMAMLAAEGHRVVLVVATAGERGLADMDPGEALGETRMKELYQSAAVLGCARVECLGYGDSGLSPQGGVADERPDNAFIDADTEKAAGALAAILREEEADLLTIYDPAGGYGHPDHVQVHRVGRRAAEIAGTPIVLEATVNRDPLLRLLRMAGKVYRFPPEFDVRTFESAYSAERDHHPPGQRAPLRAAEAGRDGRARVPGLRRRQRPHARRDAQSAWPALPPGLRHRVVRPARPAAGHPGASSLRPGAEIVPPRWTRPRRAAARLGADEEQVAADHAVRPLAGPGSGARGLPAADRAHPDRQARLVAGDLGRLRLARRRHHRADDRAVAAQPAGVHVRADGIPAGAGAPAGAHAQRGGQRGEQPAAVRRRRRGRADVRDGQGVGLPQPLDRGHDAGQRRVEHPVQVRPAEPSASSPC